MKEYLETAEAVAGELGTDIRAGLTEDAAAARLAEHGENKLREKKKTSLAVRFLILTLARLACATDRAGWKYTETACLS